MAIREASVSGYRRAGLKWSVAHKLLQETQGDAIRITMVSASHSCYGRVQCHRGPQLRSRAARTEEHLRTTQTSDLCTLEAGVVLHKRRSSPSRWSQEPRLAKCRNQPAAHDGEGYQALKCGGRHPLLSPYVSTWTVSTWSLCPSPSRPFRTWAVSLLQLRIFSGLSTPLYGHGFPGRPVGSIDFSRVVGCLTWSRVDGSSSLSLFRFTGGWVYELMER